MTYKIVKDVREYYEDHNVDHDEVIKDGFKYIQSAVGYMNRRFNSKKYKNDLNKRFLESRAIKIEEHFTVLDENDDNVTKCYLTHTVKRDHGRFPWGN